MVEDSRRENGADEAERLVKTVRVDANRSSAGPSLCAESLDAEGALLRWSVGLFLLEAGGSRF